MHTTPPWFRAWHRLHRQRGDYVTAGEWWDHVVRVGDDPARVLLERTGLPPSRAERRQAQREAEAGLSYVRPEPDWLALFSVAKAQGRRRALITNGGPRWVFDVLPRSMKELLDFIRPCLVETEAKPGPARFWEACEILEVPPENAVAFDDSAHGGLAALRAGIRLIHVPTPFTEHQRIRGAHRVASLAHVSLDWIDNVVMRRPIELPVHHAQLQAIGV